VLLGNGVGSFGNYVVARSGSSVATAAFQGSASISLGAGAGDGFAGGLQCVVSYSGAFTVTRHNYLNIVQPTLTSGAAITNGCFARFNAAAGTHVAVDAATTKTTPGGVDAWVKINVNGTVLYMPAYTSKTA
jgi:hypothetical protein